MGLVEQAWQTQDKIKALDLRLKELRRGDTEEDDQEGLPLKRMEKSWKSTLSERVKS